MKNLWLAKQKFFSIIEHKLKVLLLAFQLEFIKCLVKKYKLEVSWFVLIHLYIFYLIIFT